MTSLEYIAGFFDGEGFISIQKASHRSHSGSRYWLIAAISNTNKYVLDEIQKVVGGNVMMYKHKFRDGIGYHYRLTFYSRKAYEFIKLIQPYLKVKREEADTAIAYQESLRPYGSRIPLTNDELCFQDKCYNDIKDRHGNRVLLKTSI